MKEHRYVGVFALTILALCLAGIAQAQTGPTRSTPCSATTAWNAVCISFVPPTTYSDGVAIPSGTPLTYRVEDRLGTTGAFATVPHTGAAPNLLVSNLAPGTHYLRMFANAGNGDSDASNVANKGVTTGTPSAPVIVIAAVIHPDRPPTYRIIQQINLRPNEVVFVAPADMRPLFANR